MHLLLISACSNKENSASKRQADFHVLILEGEMQIVDCGNVFYAYGFKFKSTENDSSVVGIILCPDGYGDNFFKSGRKYNVKYTGEGIMDSIKGCSLQNPYEKYKLPTYFITKINKSP